MLNVLQVAGEIETIKYAQSITDLILEIQTCFTGTEERIVVEKRDELKNPHYPNAIGFIAFEDYPTAPEFYVYAEESEDGEYNVVDVHTFER